MVERTIIAIVSLMGVIAFGVVVRYCNRRSVISKKVIAPAMNGKTRGEPTLLYFWSQQCAQCRPQQMAIDDARTMLQESGNELAVVKYNALESPELAREMHVLTLPTTVWLDPDGSVTEWNAGLTNAQKLVRQYGQQAARRQSDGFVS